MQIYFLINIDRYLFRIRVTELVYRNIISWARKCIRPQMISYNISLRALREIVFALENLFPCRKNSGRVHGSLTAGYCGISVDFDVRFRPRYRPPYADGTRHERFGTSLGKLARDEMTVLTSKLWFFSLGLALSLSLCLIMFSSRSLILNISFL